MLKAFFWGMVATASLVLGGLVAWHFSLGKRTIGVIMGFGAGALISAVSYELIFESVRLARGTGFPAMGFFAGAAVFFVMDQWVAYLGGGNPVEIEASSRSRLVVPMVLAIILDGIPESIVLGVVLFREGSISLALLAAIFISNLPEAIAGSIGMRAGGMRQSRSLLLWCVIALVCAAATVAGYSLFRTASVRWLSFIEAFAGGAILIMLANSMIPEAYEHGGKLTGVFTVLGFFVSVVIILVEHS